MKHARIFLGRQKKTEGFFWVTEKGLRDVSLFSRGREGTILGGRVIIFFLLSGGGSQFFPWFFRGGS